MQHGIRLLCTMDLVQRKWLLIRWVARWQLVYCDDAQERSVTIIGAFVCRQQIHTREMRCHVLVSYLTWCALCCMMNGYSFYGK